MRPSLHVRPPQGWINDPNGLIWHEGRYHVFFQHNPRSVLHGDIEWGHAWSTDLATWAYGPSALTPQAGGRDGSGCWSGCVTLDDDGVPAAVYTGVRDGSHDAAAIVARTRDGLTTFDQPGVVSAGMPDHQGISDVRDPFVYRHAGHRYVVQGAGHNVEGPARLLVYDADDLDSWTLLGDLLTDSDPVASEVAAAQIWECPNLVRLGDEWLLVLSLWHWVDGAHALAGVRYLVGDLDHSGPCPRFHPRRGGTVDAGVAFYAPQLVVLADRCLMWGWSWEVGRTPEQLKEAGWAGVLTFPREVEMGGDGHPRFVPARELMALRREAPLTDALRAPAFEVSGRDLGLSLDGTPVVALAGDGTVMVDASIVEAFGANGRTATTRAYPGPSSEWSVTGEVTHSWVLEPTSASGC